MTVKNTWYDWYDWSIKRKFEGIINDLQNPETWKIQLTIAIIFISSKDIDEERLMHSKWRLMINQINLLKNVLNRFFIDFKSC